MYWEIVFATDRDSVVHLKLHFPDNTTECNKYTFKLSILRYVFIEVQQDFFLIYLKMPLFVVLK